MASKSKIRHGNSHLTVFPWVHPRDKSRHWRFGFQDAGGVWKYRTFPTKAAAEDAAANHLHEAPTGFSFTALDHDSRRFLEEVHGRVPAGERLAVLTWLRSRDSSCKIAVALARYHAHKIATAGEETPWIATQHTLLKEVAKSFAGRRMSEISSDDLAAWWTTRGDGLAAKSRKDIRGHLVSFWRWAYRQGLAGSDAVTAPERLPSIPADPGEKRIFTPAELCAVLNAVHRDFRAWVVLGALAGLRPEEIAPGPSKRANKRGILCEEIDWEFSVIRLPAIVSKVNRPRIVPMSDALKAGLQWAGIEPGMTGRTTLRNPSQDQELSRLGRDLFQGPWPKDALRHSYGSYRNACLRSLDQVAEEMGTSVAMLHKHYHNPQPQALGDAWFALRPGADGRWTVPAPTVNVTTAPAAEIIPLRQQA